MRILNFRYWEYVRVFMDQEREHSDMNGACQREHSIQLVIWIGHCAECKELVGRIEAYSMTTLLPLSFILPAACHYSGLHCNLPNSTSNHLLKRLSNAVTRCSIGHADFGLLQRSQMLRKGMFSAIGPLKMQYQPAGCSMTYQGSNMRRNMAVKHDRWMVLIVS